MIYIDYHLSFSSSIGKTKQNQVEQTKKQQMIYIANLVEAYSQHVEFLLEICALTHKKE